MIKINYMSTLFVGIDVSSKSNVVYAMDFDENKYIDASFGNNQPGADELAGKIAACIQKHPHLNTIIVALESTSVYSIHIYSLAYSCAESSKPKSACMARLIRPCITSLLFQKLSAYSTVFLISQAS